MSNEITSDASNTDINPPSEPVTTRREAITAFVGVALAGAASCLGCHSNSVGETPVGGGTAPATVAGGALGSIAQLKGSKVPVAVTVNGSQAFVVFTGGMPRVISALCPHKGCAVAFDPTQQEFICPCHGSAFGPDGSFLHGVAQAPLPVLKSHVTGDTLYADS